jgi:hypothetical protein
MSKSNWQKSMKNVSLYDSRRHKKQRFSCEVAISKIDENRLKVFQNNELRYYNLLVEMLQNRARIYPQSLINLTPEQIKLFGGLAFASQSLKELQAGQEPHPRLVPLQNLWTKSNYKNKFTPDLELLYNTVGIKLLLDPNTREFMALELLRFFTEQANAFSSAVNSEKTEIAYKVTPQTLHSVDITQKRHNQLPRKSVSWRWDTKNESSYVKTPYTFDELEIPGLNLNEDIEWDLMIIHQLPGKVPLWDTPWIVEFQKSSTKYLIKYLDLVNPKAGSAFSAAMRRR